MPVNMNALRRRRSPWVIAAAAAASLLVACDKDGGGSNETPYFQFDDLGGGSSIIQVYPGPGDTAADKVSNGTYRHGERAGVVCHAVGRTVVSHPEVGEQERESRDWYKLAGSTVVRGPDHYATATYGSLQPPGATVPECPGPPVPPSSSPASVPAIATPS